MSEDAIVINVIMSFVAGMILLVAFNAPSATERCLTEANTKEKWSCVKPNKKSLTRRRDSV